MKLIPSVRFTRDLGKLEKGNSKLRRSIQKTLYRLQTNPDYPSLRLHKLAGRDIYSISVDLSVCIIFSRREDSIYLLRIGKHEEVY